MTKINGIGPATARLLNENGITSFAQLADTDQNGLQQILETAGSKFRLIDCSTWRHQSEFACKGDWSGLGRWYSQQKSESSSETCQSASTDCNEQSMNEQTCTTSSSKADDLTMISGIGPATAKLLRQNGITSFEQLRTVESKWFERLFKKSGDQFASLNWRTWNDQARFASVGDWNGLRDWCLSNNPSIETKTSSGKTRSTSNSSTAGTVASSSTPDDLTTISGIGPATAKILKKNGITRFGQIAAMSGAQLENIFASSGARFQLVDPTSWPQQAMEFLKGSGECTLESSLLNEISEIQSLQIPTESLNSNSTQPTNAKS